MILGIGCLIIGYSKLDLTDISDSPNLYFQISNICIFATPSLLTVRSLAGVMGWVILGGKDMTGMAYPEGFR